jgi:hypothetical protein
MGGLDNSGMGKSSGMSMIIRSIAQHLPGKVAKAQAQSMWCWRANGNS